MSAIKIVILAILQISFSVAQSFNDYSLPALQKCDDNNLPREASIVEIPGHRMHNGQPFHFRLVSKCATRLPHCMKSKCPTQMTELSIPFSAILHPEPLLNSSLDVYEYEPVTIMHFTTVGFFRLDNEYFSPDDFCVYSLAENDFSVKICPSKCAHQEFSIMGRSTVEMEIPNDGMDRLEVCVPKCCSLDKVFTVEKQHLECAYSGTKVPWTPLVHRSADRQICGEKRMNLKIHYVMHQPPDCEHFNKYFLNPDVAAVFGTNRVRFRYLTNGSALLRELGGKQWTYLEPGSFCLDGVQTRDRLYTGGANDQFLLHCQSYEFSEKNGSQLSDEQLPVYETRLTASGIAYVVLLFSGIPFLLVTAVVYILAWGQQNVHGWTQFSHTLAILLHYLAAAFANTFSRVLTSDHNASTVCMLVGIINHLFILASFFWLTIINYDLFSMFRHLKTTVGRSRGVKRFIVYSLIAWGVPLVVVTISVILDNLYGLYGDDADCEVDVVVPLYGHKSCYIVAEARAYYLYYPVGGIMVINLILAFCTIYNMYHHGRESAKAHGEFKKNTKHRRKFSIMAKLFVVMGLVWIFEVFVWSFIKGNEVLPWYLVFPDVLHTIQAIAIFILFACQPKILNQVADKYPSLEGFTELLKRFSCTSKRSQDKAGTSSISGSVAVGNGARNQAMVIDDVKV